VKRHILALLKVVASSQHCPVISELADVLDVDEALRVHGAARLGGRAIVYACPAA